MPDRFCLQCSSGMEQFQTSQKFASATIEYAVGPCNTSSLGKGKLSQGRHVANITGPWGLCEIRHAAPELLDETDNLEQPSWSRVDAEFAGSPSRMVRLHESEGHEHLDVTDAMASLKTTYSHLSTSMKMQLTLSMRGLSIDIENSFGKTNKLQAAFAFIVNTCLLWTMLIASGFLQENMTHRLLFLRGLIWNAYLPFTVSIVYLFKLCALHVTPTKVELLFLLMAQAACLSGLAATPLEFGLGIYQQGGFAIGQSLSLCCFFWQGAKMKDLMSVVVANFNIWLTLVFCFFSIAMFPEIANFSETFAGFCLFSAISFAETIGVIVECCRMKYFQDTQSTVFLANTYISFTHCMAESFRLSALLYVSIQDKTNKAWIASFVSALVINALNRTNWIRWAVATSCLSKPERLAPQMTTHVHQNARYVHGYFRFSGPLALILARAALIGGDDPHVWWYNDTVPLVLFASLLEEFVEDLTVWQLMRRKLDAPWSRIASEYYRSLEFGDPRKAYTYHSDGTAEPVRLRECHIIVPLMCSCAGAYCSVFCLICLTSIQYQLGQCQEPKFRFSQSGILKWPIESVCD